MPNLLVKMGSQRFLVPLRLCGIVAEDLGRSLNQGLLPGMNLRGMNFKPAGQLSNSLFPWSAAKATLALNAGLCFFLLCFIFLLLYFYYF